MDNPFFLKIKRVLGYDDYDDVAVRVYPNRLMPPTDITHSASTGWEVSVGLKWLEDNLSKEEWAAYVALRMEGKKVYE